VSAPVGKVYMGPLHAEVLGDTEGRPLFATADGVDHGVLLGTLDTDGLTPQKETR